MSNRKVIYIKEEGVLGIAYVGPNGAHAIWYDLFMLHKSFLEPHEYIIFDDLEQKFDD